MDNPNGEGIKIELCVKCHRILHTNIIPVMLFNHIEDKDSAIRDLKKFTFDWIGAEEDKIIRCIQCDAELDIEDKVCPYCNKLNEVEDGNS
jgi:hypothetical protein